MVKLVSALLVLGSGSVHPLHTTLTTIEWRAETRRLDVAVRVFTQDLHDAVSRNGMAGSAFVPDSVVCRYARTALVMQDASGRALGPATCTVERAEDLTWIRLDEPLGSPVGARVLNAFLFELFSDQVNVVQATLVGRSRTLLFTSGDQPKAIT